MARKRPGRNWGNSVKVTKDVVYKKLKIMLYGPEGTGKTYFIRTAPNPFIIATEDGVLALHDQTIPYFLIDDSIAIYDTIIEIIEAASRKEIIKDKEGNIVVDFNKVDTIVLDSIWMLNARMIKEIKEEFNKDKFQHDQWGVLLDRMRDCILKLLELDYHVIATIGEKIYTNEMDEKSKEYGYNLQGSFRDQIGYLFDFNIYMKKEATGRKVVYKALTRDFEGHKAKSRVDIPAEIVDPTFDKIAGPVAEALQYFIKLKR